jgi:hypothetical protein
MSEILTQISLLQGSERYCTFAMQVKGVEAE